MGRVRISAKAGFSQLHVRVRTGIGFAGNEIVAVFRIRVGTEINSAALIVGGHHARADGLTSLGVLAGAVGVWLGFPLADPIVGLLITIAILRIAWESGKAVLLAPGGEPHPGLESGGGEGNAV